MTLSWGSYSLESFCRCGFHISLWCRVLNVQFSVTWLRTSLFSSLFLFITFSILFITTQIPYSSSYPASYIVVVRVKVCFTFPNNIPLVPLEIGGGSWPTFHFLLTQFSVLVDLFFFISCQPFYYFPSMQQDTTGCRNWVVLQLKVYW